MRDNESMRNNKINVHVHNKKVHGWRSTGNLFSTKKLSLIKKLSK